MPWSWKKPPTLEKYEQKWSKWFKVNRWWITIASLAALPFISAFIVIAIDLDWLGNNDWFDLEREVWKKSIWEWLELLIAPIVFALAGFFIRQLLERQEDDRRKLSEKQEDDRRKHEAFKDYLDDITALFLSDNWERAVQEKRNHQTDNQKVFAIAKARTLAALNELDKERQIQLIQFLSESRELANFTFPGRGLDLEGAKLIGVNLEGADLYQANLEGATLYEVSLKGANPDQANLEGAKLISANLEGVTLISINLEGATMESVNLEGAKLISANLEGAILDLSSLEGATLYQANLENAALMLTALKNANLMSANLKGATLFNANLKDIRWDNKTQWDGAKNLDTAKNIPENLKKQLKLPPYDTPESDSTTEEE